MGTKKTFTFMVQGGNATTGPPIGPALGPLGVNIAEVVKVINEKTKEFSGLTVPVKVTVDLDTKEFEVEVGTPSTAALIFKEAGIQTGAHQPGREQAANLTIEQVAKIAYIKFRDLRSKTFRGAVKQVLGSCKSAGVLVEGKDPKIVSKEIDQGLYDEVLKKYEEKLKEEGLL
ncbi:MAG: 50S ribosomal protein L11 [Thermoprotei archaeon]|nr:MAG: 50S ribosomal protein L11 [Thermoprotei archaeon]